MQRVIKEKEVKQKCTIMTCQRHSNENLSYTRLMRFQVLQKMAHPLVIGLYAAFQTTETLVLVSFYPPQHSRLE